MSAFRLATLNREQTRSVVALFCGMKTARSITNFIRIIPTAYASTPLSFGSGTSRFNPRFLSARPAPSFGLVYGTINLATACYEAIIRDSFDVLPSRILKPATYSNRSAVNLSTTPGTALTLLDMTSGNAARCDVPADVIRYSDYRAGQYFSEFVYAEMADVDGLFYPSRFTEMLCIAVYDRAIPKLVSAGSPVQLTRRIVAPIMASWNVQVK